jgi:hypothetical protein
MLCDVNCTGCKHWKSVCTSAPAGVMLGAKGGGTLLSALRQRLLEGRHATAQQPPLGSACRRLLLPLHAEVCHVSALSDLRDPPRSCRKQSSIGPHDALYAL